MDGYISKNHITLLYITNDLTKFNSCKMKVAFVMPYLLKASVSIFVLSSVLIGVIEFKILFRIIR